VTDCREPVYKTPTNSRNHNLSREISIWHQRMRKDVIRTTLANTAVNPRNWASAHCDGIRTLACFVAIPTELKSVGTKRNKSLS
jgi:hypothetical protein